MHLFYFLKSLLGYPELAGCNMIVRRDIFLKTGGFSSNIIISQVKETIHPGKICPPRDEPSDLPNMP